MHTASYEFLMKPKESAGCHQTLSVWVGSGDETIVMHEQSMKQSPTVQDMFQLENQQEMLSTIVLIFIYVLYLSHY